MGRIVKGLKVEGRKSAVLSLCLFMAITGCKEQSKEQSSFSDPAYSRQYREQSAIAIISLSETNVTTSGKIQLMIEVHAEPASDIIFPDIRYAIDPLTVADGYTEPLQTLPNGQMLTRRAWTLLPALPGTYEVPELEISAGDLVLKTDPIAIAVSSLLPKGIEEFQIKDIAPVASLLPEQEQKQRVLAITLSTLAGLAILFFIIRKLLIKEPEQVIPCHEKALAAMNELPENAVERIHTFNRILIAYIEERYALPLGGKTQREIEILLKDNTSDFSSVLTFLETCEQIRFSNQVPNGFTAETEQFIRNYIEETKEELCD